MPKGTPKSSGGKGGQFHDAKTGQFVTKPYADKHPSTTFKESTRKK
jgi:hypothetical protein